MEYIRVVFVELVATFHSDLNNEIEAVLILMRNLSIFKVTQSLTMSRKSHIGYLVTILLQPIGQEYQSAVEPCVAVQGNHCMPHKHC